MAIGLDVRLIGDRALLRSLIRFDREVAQRATRDAINRTINNMRTVAIIEASRWLGVKRKDIVKRFNFTITAKHGAIGIIGAKRNKRMVATAIGRGRPFNLIRWETSEGPNGVTSSAWGAAKHYPNTVITRAPARFVAFIDKTKKGAKRLKSKGAFGPGLTHALLEDRIARAIEKEGEAKFPAHFASRANEALRRAGWGSRVG